MGTETPVLDVPRQVLSSWRDRSRGAVACCGIPHRAEFTARPIVEGEAAQLDWKAARR